ncbi:MAG: LAGLIDADG family homing endonuclease [Candidatus Doudnabacteria bacterium]|nr:LAGLIDADG family homing endonuclease [Candidatus Doudnabacteria bacterium]
MKQTYSKNASRADNQQERLFKIGWIIGLVDGEGCFSIGFVKQPDRKEPKRIRRGYTTGYQVAHEFAVVQGARSLKCLKELKSFFGIGDIYINRRHDNHKEDLFRYSVARRQDLIEVIIPFFQKYHLRTAKKQDFQIFSKCVKLMHLNKHKTKEGVIKIALLSEKMNHRKSRADLIRILRDQTPGSPMRREERVPSA